MKINSEHIYILDIETSSEFKGAKKPLDRSKNTIVDIGIKNTNTTERLSLDTPKKHRKMLHIIKDKKLKIICHNGNFDLTNIWTHYKIDLSHNLYIDSMVLAKIVYAHDEAGLEHLAVKHCGYKPWKKGAKKTGNDDYLFTDLDATEDVAKTLLKSLPKHQRELFKQVMSWYREFIRIQYNGVPVDLTQLLSAKKELSNKRDKLKKALNSVAPINWNSTQQIAKVLHEDFKIPARRYTKSGKVSCDNVALNELIEVGDDIPISKVNPKYKSGKGIILILLEYRELEKACKFLDDWLERMIDGRLYPYINIVGARTGRTTSSEPNIQQVPKMKALRTCFNAPEGKLFAEFDYSQIELRIAAHISQDPTMIEAYQKSLDLHDITARAMYGDNVEIDKFKRVTAKTVNFGFIYGRQAKGFHKQMVENFRIPITLQDAEAWRTNFFRTYPKLNDYYLKIEREAMATGGVTTLTNRFRYYEGVFGNSYQKSEALRSAVNMPVQGLASDILVSSACEVNKIPGVKVCATIHDAVLVEVDPNIISKEDAEKEIKRVMENPRLFEVFNIKLDVPLVVDCEWGAWGS